MPNIALELHGRRHERVVFGKLEFGGENAAFVGGSFGTLDHGFPEEEVVFVDGAGGDAFGRVCGEVLVFLEEALGGDGGHGGWLMEGFLVWVEVEDALFVGLWCWGSKLCCLCMYTVCYRTKGRNQEVTS
jgi:hypothetical protein